MGGNALKHLNVERKGAEDFQRISNSVIQSIKSFVTKSAVVPYYRLKQDFGDADILFTTNQLGREICDHIHNLFNPRSLYVNSSCYSFDVENFQIDLIQSTDELFDVSLDYYSYNDVGNLIGRIAHKMGLKYGHNGLTLPIRKDDSHLGETIIVSRDTRKILDFLGFDSRRFFLGFDTLEDIFLFVTQSKYFNPEIFAFENLNHINRTRNRKRKVYAQFIDWLTERNTSKYIFNTNKSNYLTSIDHHFPESNIFQRIKEVEEKINNNKINKEKFNGDIIIKLRNIQGKELGQFIYKFKNQFVSEDAFNSWIYNSTQDTINNEIINFE